MDWCLNERSGSFQAFWLSFAWHLWPHLWIYCAAAIAMGFLQHFGFRLPTLLTGEGLCKFFWFSELQCLQHSYFHPLSSSFIYHISVKSWESNQGLTTCVGALLNCTLGKSTCTIFHSSGWAWALLVVLRDAPHGVEQDWFKNLEY